MAEPENMTPETVEVAKDTVEVTDREILPVLPDLTVTAPSGGNNTDWSYKDMAERWVRTGNFIWKSTDVEEALNYISVKSLIMNHPRVKEASRSFRMMKFGKVRIRFQYVTNFIWQGLALVSWTPPALSYAPDLSDYITRYMLSTTCCKMVLAENIAAEVIAPMAILPEWIPLKTSPYEIGKNLYNEDYWGYASMLVASRTRFAAESAQDLPIEIFISIEDLEFAIPVPPRVPAPLQGKTEEVFWVPNTDKFQKSDGAGPTLTTQNQSNPGPGALTQAGATNVKALCAQQSFLTRFTITDKTVGSTMLAQWYVTPQLYDRPAEQVGGTKYPRDCLSFVSKFADAWYGSIEYEIVCSRSYKQVFSFVALFAPANEVVDKDNYTQFEHLEMVVSGDGNVFKFVVPWKSHLPKLSLCENFGVEDTTVWHTCFTGHVQIWLVNSMSRSRDDSDTIDFTVWRKGGPDLTFYYPYCSYYVGYNFDNLGETEVFEQRLVDEPFDANTPILGRPTYAKNPTCAGTELVDLRQIYERYTKVRLNYKYDNPALMTQQPIPVSPIWRPLRDVNSPLYGISSLFLCWSGTFTYTMWTDVSFNSYNYVFMRRTLRQYPRVGERNGKYFTAPAGEFFGKNSDGRAPTTKLPTSYMMQLQTPYHPFFRAYYCKEALDSDFGSEFEPHENIPYESVNGYIICDSYNPSDGVRPTKVEIHITPNPDFQLGVFRGIQNEAMHVLFSPLDRDTDRTVTPMFIGKSPYGRYPDPGPDPHSVEPEYEEIYEDLYPRAPPRPSTSRGPRIWFSDGVVESKENFDLSFKLLPFYRGSWDMYFMWSCQEGITHPGLMLFAYVPITGCSPLELQREIFNSFTPIDVCQEYHLPMSDKGHNMCRSCFFLRNKKLKDLHFSCAYDSERADTWLADIIRHKHATGRRSILGVTMHHYLLSNRILQTFAMWVDRRAWSKWKFVYVIDYVNNCQSVEFVEDLEDPFRTGMCYRYSNAFVNQLWWGYKDYKLKDLPILDTYGTEHNYNSEDDEPVYEMKKWGDDHISTGDFVITVLEHRYPDFKQSHRTRKATTRLYNFINEEHCTDYNTLNWSVYDLDGIYELRRNRSGTVFPDDFFLFTEVVEIPDWFYYGEPYPFKINWDEDRDSDYDDEPPAHYVFREPDEPEEWGFIPPENRDELHVHFDAEVQAKGDEKPGKSTGTFSSLRNIGVSTNEAALEVKEAAIAIKEAAVASLEVKEAASVIKEAALSVKTSISTMTTKMDSQSERMISSFETLAHEMQLASGSISNASTKATEKFGNFLDNIDFGVSKMGGVTPVLMSLLEAVTHNNVKGWVWFGVKMSVAMEIPQEAYRAIARYLKNNPKTMDEVPVGMTEGYESLKFDTDLASVIPNVLTLVLMAGGFYSLGGLEKDDKRVKTMWDYLSIRCRDTTNMVRGVSDMKTTFIMLRDFMLGAMVDVGILKPTPQMQLTEWYEKTYKGVLEDISFFMEEENFRDFHYEAEKRARFKAMMGSFVKLWHHSNRVGANREEINSINVLTRRVDILFNKAVNATAPGSFRVCPYGICYFGESGIGKGSLTVMVGKFFAQLQQWPQDDNLIFTRTPGMDHLDGYNFQPIYIEDDKDQIDDIDESKLYIMASSNVPFVIPMAQLEKKGAFFGASLMLSSTNNVYPEPVGIADKVAYQRRRDLLWEVFPDPDCKTDCTKAMYRLLPSVGVKYTGITDDSKETTVDFWDHLRISYLNFLKHMQGQYSLIKMVREKQFRPLIIQKGPMTKEFAKKLFIKMFGEKLPDLSQDAGDFIAQDWDEALEFDEVPDAAEALKKFIIKKEVSYEDSLNPFLTDGETQMKAESDDEGQGDGYQTPTSDDSSYVEIKSSDLKNGEISASEAKQNSDALGEATIAEQKKELEELIRKRQELMSSTGRVLNKIAIEKLETDVKQSLRAPIRRTTAERRALHAKAKSISKTVVDLAPEVIKTNPFETSSDDDETAPEELDYLAALKCLDITLTPTLTPKRGNVRMSMQGLKLPPAEVLWFVIKKPREDLIYYFKSACRILNAGDPNPYHNWYDAAKFAFDNDESLDDAIKSAHTKVGDFFTESNELNAFVSNDTDVRISLTVDDAKIIRPILEVERLTPEGRKYLGVPVVQGSLLHTQIMESLFKYDKLSDQNLEEAMTMYATSNYTPKTPEQVWREKRGEMHKWLVCSLKWDSITADKYIKHCDNVWENNEKCDIAVHPTDATRRIECLPITQVSCQEWVRMRKATEGYFYELMAEPASVLQAVAGMAIIAWKEIKLGSIKFNFPIPFSPFFAGTYVTRWFIRKFYPQEHWIRIENEAFKGIRIVRSALLNPFSTLKYRAEWHMMNGPLTAGAMNLCSLANLIGNIFLAVGSLFPHAVYLIVQPSKVKKVYEFTMHKMMSLLAWITGFNKPPSPTEFHQSASELKAMWAIKKDETHSFLMKHLTSFINYCGEMEVIKCFGGDKMAKFFNFMYNVIPGALAIYAAYRGASFLWNWFGLSKPKNKAIESSSSESDSEQDEEPCETESMPIQTHAHSDVPNDGKKHAHSHTCDNCSTVFIHAHKKNTEEYSKTHPHLCEKCKQKQRAQAKFDRERGINTPVEITEDEVETYSAGRVGRKTKNRRNRKVVTEEKVEKDPAALRFASGEAEGADYENAEATKTKIMKNMVLLRYNGFELNGIGLCGRYILVPQHFFGGQMTGTGVLEVWSRTQEHMFKIDVGKQVLRPSFYTVQSESYVVDYCIIDLSSELRLHSFVDIRNLFASGKDKEPDQPGTSQIVQAEGKKTTFITTRVVGKERTFHTMTIVMKFQGANVYVQPSRGMKYIAPAMWLYSAPTKSGDCGAPLFCPALGGNGMIVGIHVRGKPSNEDYSGGIVVSIEMINKLIPSDKKFVSELGETECYEELKEYGVILSPELPDSYDIPVEPEYRFVGQIISKPPHKPTKTDLRPSLLFDKVYKHTTEPSVLSKRDPRKHDPKLDPYVEATKGLKRLRPLTAEHLRMAVHHRVQTISKHIRETKYLGPMRVLTLEEAINGIPEWGIDPIQMSTSEGAPYTFMRPPGARGRRWLFEVVRVEEDGRTIYRPGPLLMKDIRKILTSALQRRVCVLNYFTDWLKDEKRKLAKIWTGSTRLFSGHNVPWLIVLRMLLSSIIQFLNTHGLEIGYAPGLNVHGVDASILARLLFQHPYHLALDVSKWDKVYQPEEFEAVAHEFEEIARLHYTWDLSTFTDLGVPVTCTAEIEIIFYVCARCGQVRFHVNGKVVYRTDTGMPSGCLWTTPANTEGNHIRHSVVWLDLAKLEMQKRSKHYDTSKPSLFNLNYRDEVFYLAAYGDDTADSTAEEVKDWFSPENRIKVLSDYGYTYTSARKDKDLTFTYDDDDAFQFLKSTFRFEAGNCHMAMDTKVIQELTNWIRKGLPPLDALQSNIHDAQEMAYSHGRAFFEDFTDTVEAVCLKEGLPISFKIFEEFEFRWRQAHDQM